MIHVTVLEGNPPGPVPKALVNVASGGGGWTDASGILVLRAIRTGRQKLIVTVRDHPETTLVVDVRHDKATNVVLRLFFPPGSWVEELPQHRGLLKGKVVRAVDGSPMPYALAHSRMRSWTQTALVDSAGDFALSITAGGSPVSIKAFAAPELVDTVNIAPRDSLTRIFRMRDPRWERYLHIRDSLIVRGGWPPTIDPTLLQRLRGSPKPRVLRIDPRRSVYPAPSDSNRYVGSWPIVGESRDADVREFHRLLDALGDSILYLPGLRGQSKMCIFSPGIAVRVEGKSPRTDLVLCYECGQFVILGNDGLRQGGDFEGQGEAFVRFAKSAFPADSAIQALSTSRYRPPRR